MITSVGQLLLLAVEKDHRAVGSPVSCFQPSLILNLLFLLYLGMMAHVRRPSSARSEKKKKKRKEKLINRTSRKDSRVIHVALFGFNFRLPGWLFSFSQGTGLPVELCVRCTSERCF